MKRLRSGLTAWFSQIHLVPGVTPPHSWRRYAGAASGTGVVTYTDGTTQSFTISLADSYANAPASGDQLAATTSNWNAPPVNTPGNGVNAMHIFAMATGG
jgi:hypothetical protein